MVFSNNQKRFHLGLIPDGNRRWAKVKGLHSSKGHKHGAKKMEMFLKWAALKPEIKEISVYALSEENFKRKKEELEWLYNIYSEGLKNLMKSSLIHDNKINVNFVSTNEKELPKGLIDLFFQLKSETKLYTNKVLNILIGYTGQNEILRAVGSPLNRLKNLLFGLTEKDLERALKIKNPCDFVIRTAFEEKPREAKSGFLLWQSAYSEYYHLNKHFPDITINDLEKAWTYFLKTKQRKGK